MIKDVVFLISAGLCSIAFLAMAGVALFSPRPGITLHRPGPVRDGLDRLRRARRKIDDYVNGVGQAAAIAMEDFGNPFVPAMIHNSASSLIARIGEGAKVYEISGDMRIFLTRRTYDVGAWLEYMLIKGAWANTVPAHRAGLRALINGIRHAIIYPEELRAVILGPDGAVTQEGIDIGNDWAFDRVRAGAGLELAGVIDAEALVRACLTAMVTACNVAMSDNHPGVKRIPILTLKDVARGQLGHDDMTRLTDEIVKATGRAKPIFRDENVADNGNEI